MDMEPWLVLARAPGLHAGLLQPLLGRAGSPAAILRLPRDALAGAGLGGAAVEWIRRPDPVLLEQDRRWLAHSGQTLIPWDSQGYPPLLREIADAPVALYVRGHPGVLHLPQLALVGSRNPTRGGAATAAAFASHLVRHGLVITSGLAVGIDAAGHRGALAAGGLTVAVCGTGLDTVYPSAHAELAAEIAARGALVSEFPCGTPPLRQNFPRRNRLISGLSLGTLVVEAAPHSGSLVTARHAAAQGREVFAIPGSIHNLLARGCHELIRQGAKLVESAADIFSELAPHAGSIVSAARTPPAAEAPEKPDDSFRRLDKEYEILLDALGFEPSGVDVLVERTGFKAGEVASMLLILELDGRIEALPGGLYVRAPPERPILKAMQ